MKRLVTGGALAVLFGAILLKGGEVGLALFLAGAAGACAWELTRMALPGRPLLSGLVALWSAGVVGSGLTPHPLSTAILLLWGGTAATALVLVLSYSGRGDEALAWAVAVQALVYLGGGGLFALLLRSRPHGLFWLLFLVAAVAAGDTAAYYTGRALGRHRLHPRLSQGKTWEGTVGGLAASAAAAAGLAFVAPFHPPPAPLALLGLAVGAVAQVGDLAESLVKRSFGLKDSGSLLPGHGGVLDRMDGHLFAAPFLYWLLRWWQG